MVYTDDVNILGGTVPNVKKDIETLFFFVSVINQLDAQNFVLQ